MENNIIILNGFSKSIVNTDLRKEINNIIKAGDKANASAWDYAKAVSNIVEGKLFEQDFTTQANFAEFIGCSKVQITRYCKAYAFKVNYLPNYSKGDKSIERGFTVGKCHMLATLAEAEQLAAFLDYMENNYPLIKIESISEKALRDYIKKYNDSLNADSETDAETEENTQAETKPEEMAEIRYAGSIYIIPLSVLKQYEKTVIDEETGKVIETK